MATGVSPLFYPEQPRPSGELALDDSYFLVQLHDAQAFFEAGWLVKPEVLIFSSSVESSFRPETAAHSLHQIAVLQKNVPCQLGVSTNLTDWLPARSPDSLRIHLKYVVVQDDPFKELVDQMNRVNLTAKVSLVRPDWAVAVKVSKIVGQLLSYFLREGSQHDIFALTMDLNLPNLKTGYYALVGSHKDEDWPATLRVDANGRLTDATGSLLSRHSYVVVKVLALPRLGVESALDQPWGELLQAGKEQILDAYPASDKERRELLGDWQSILSQVRLLARRERGYLLKEVNELIQATQVEVQERLLPRTKGESFSGGELPVEWQDLLGVKTQAELHQSVRDYKDALALSRQLLEKYGVE